MNRTVRRAVAPAADRHRVRRKPSARYLVAALSLFIIHPAAAQTPGLGASVELVDPTALRVCADPRDLPFSDEQGEGFENKLAEMLAHKLNEPVSYTYFPQVIGFVRNTLNALRCDVIMGTAVGDTSVQTTNPYYHTTYALIFRPDSGLDGVAALDDARLKDKHIGIVAGTPPATILVQNGLMAQAKPYPLTVDTRVASSPQQMADDVAAGRIDAGVLWGPMAGYYARQTTPHLTVVPLLKESSRMDFRIAMGVRQSDQNWKRTLNRLIAESQPEIDQMLAQYGVPLLDEQGQLKNAMNPPRSRWLLLLGLVFATGAAAQPPPEPATYRMDDYRAPTPATLQGALVLTTGAAHALWLQHQAVFVDVLPRPPRPVGLPAATIWRPQPRFDISGSIWLPDTGYGALAPVMDQYFQRGLQQASAGEHDRLLIFYCLANCWMSWNAAKRALSLGYTHVGWYRDGTDGWAAQGLPTEPREPVPRPSAIE